MSNRATQERRYALVYLETRDALDILNGKLTIAMLNVPADAQVVRVFNDDSRDALGVLLSSAEFAPLPLGAVPPNLLEVRVTCGCIRITTDGPADWIASNPCTIHDASVSVELS